MNNYLEEGVPMFDQNTDRTDDRDDKNNLMLPKIQTKNKSPFKGFLDTSVVTHKLRKTIASEGNTVRNKSKTGEIDYPKNSI